MRSLFVISVLLAIVKVNSLSTHEIITSFKFIQDVLIYHDINLSLEEFVSFFIANGLFSLSLYDSTDFFERVFVGTKGHDFNIDFYGYAKQIETSPIIAKIKKVDIDFHDKIKMKCEIDPLCVQMYEEKIARNSAYYFSTDKIISQHLKQSNIKKVILDIFRYCNSIGIDLQASMVNIIDDVEYVTLFVNKLLDIIPRHELDEFMNFFVLNNHVMKRMLDIIMEQINIVLN